MTMHLSESFRIGLFATAGLAALAAGAPALAQDPLASAQAIDDETTVTEAGRSDPAADSEIGSAITVTGSRIQRPNQQSTSPIVSLSLQEIQSTGEINLGDALNDLPSLRSTFSQSNSTRFIGTAGLNLLDLRGLGTNRTLVLVNGRRHISAQPGVPTSVDVNTIPNALIERIDITTGGNSAVYGADAVAGVVNFIMRRDFEGIEGQVQGGVTDQGHRGTLFASLTAGTNFADNRGNIAVAGEFSRQEAVYFTDRDEITGAFSGRRQLQLVENTIGEPAGGNGVPDRVFLGGIRNINIAEGGLFTAACPGLVAGQPTPFGCTGERNEGGNPLGATFVFAEDSSLVRNQPLRDFRTVGSPNSVGGLGSTLGLTGQLAPEIERKAINLLASFEVSEAFRPFVEAKYVRIDAVQEGQPTFFNNTFSIDNPFLTDQARSTLIEAGVTDTFTAQRFNVDFGARGEDHRRETYRAVVGVDGRFNNNWRYEVAFNYGRLETYYETQGNVLLSRYANALNAVRDGSGNIVCGINADGDPATNDPSCVPVNLFGFGAPSQAALDYFTVTSSREQRAEQYQVTAFLSGDTSGFFELPGGAIQFAVGGEYRHETAYSAFDEVTRSGATFLNAIPVFDPPALKAKEAYAEVRIPILADLPFVQELSIEGAFRIADYNIGNVGTTEAYNAGIIWQPIDSVRLRGSYARSVRIPTQSDLFAEPSQTFLNGLVDPCDSRFINDNPNRVANCAAAGVPTTVVVDGVSQPFTNIPASGIRGLNGSNPNLDAEVADSWTAGVIFQPARGLTLSVDYYNIEINNVIFSLGAQTIINQCYDSPSGISNPFCASIFRRPDGTFEGQSDRNLGGGTISYPLAPGDRSFISGPFNFARQKTSGIDFDLNFQRDLGPVAISFRGLLSYVIERNNFTDINDPTFINQQLLELGDPEFSGSIILGLDFGVPRLTYNMRYIGEQYVNTFETFNALQGRPPENPDFSFPSQYPETFYHNLRLDFELDRGYAFYVGVDNLLDTIPPLGLNGATEGSGIYDNIGRFLYAGARFSF